MNSSIQTTAYWTMVRKEGWRVLRIWPQTLLPSAMTQTLYFVIFGTLLGSRIGEVGGSSYAAFLVPGLIMMAMLTNAFSNVASSFFGSKFQRSIEEQLVAPMSPTVLLAGFVSGGVFRGILIGLLIYGVSAAFSPVIPVHLWAVIIFGILCVLLFSLLGFLNGLFAKKFDDVSIIPTFVLTPLTYLGGVFYSLDQLPGIWGTIAKLNPLAYLIEGFRYGFSGQGDSHLVIISAGCLAILNILLTGVLLHMIRHGRGLRS